MAFRVAHSANCASLTMQEVQTNDKPPACTCNHAARERVRKAQRRSMSMGVGEGVMLRSVFTDGITLGNGNYWMPPKGLNA